MWKGVVVRKTGVEGVGLGRRVWKGMVVRKTDVEGVVVRKTGVE